MITCVIPVKGPRLWLNAEDLLLPLLAVRRLIIKLGVSAYWIAGNLIYIDADDKILKCGADHEK